MTTPGGLSGIVPESWSLGLSPVVARRLLNVTSIVVVAALLLKVGDPEFLLDAVWVTLTISAFVLGLRATVFRMAGILILIATSAAVDVGFGRPVEDELGDLTEWPLLIVISTVVALMADRVSSTARRYAALYRQASDRLTTAQEDERARLARDLHDGVGQTLTAVVLTLDAAEASLRQTRGTEASAIGSSPSAAEAAVGRARDLSIAALDETRDVAAQLRPPRINEIGLGAAIGDLAETAGIPVEVRFRASILPPSVIDPNRQIDAYRVIQEAVGNAARHSHAENVWIDAEITDGLIRLTVGDDGVGFDRATTPVGLGLAGMQERAAILRAQLEVRSEPGAGTTVELLMPVLTPAGAPGLAAATVRRVEGML
ncbi:MAG: sensor histidine kinase [Actinomycetota bacterium]|nr:sensor histidine kinase [Actinomycetota bacterium]